MRANLEDNRTYRLRSFAPKRPSVTLVLTGLFIIPRDGPELYMLDAGASAKSVRLPALSEEFSVLIANIGATYGISVYDASGVLQATCNVGEVKYFFACQSRWVWLNGNYIVNGDVTGMTDELRVVTAAGVQTVGTVESGLILNKALASATTINLPSVNVRLGKPVRIIDWAGNVDINNPVTLVPNGAEKINNAATWEASNLSSGGIVLYPNTALGGWTVGA